MEGDRKERDEGDKVGTRKCGAYQDPQIFSREPKNGWSARLLLVGPEPGVTDRVRRVIRNI